MPPQAPEVSTLVEASPPPSFEQNIDLDPGDLTEAVKDGTLEEEGRGGDSEVEGGGEAGDEGGRRKRRVPESVVEFQARARPVLDKIGKFVQENFLLLSFAVAVIIAMSWPALGLWLGQGKVAGVVVLTALNNIIVFFISGLTLKTGAMKDLVQHWVGVVYGLLAILLFTPFFGYIMLLIPLTPPEFSVGLTIFCVVPTTLGVGVALTAASRGNQALALLLTVSTNVLGIFTVPFLLRLILHSSDVLSVDPVNLVVKLVVTVLVPTIVGKLLRDLIPAVKRFVIKHKVFLSMFSTFQLALIILLTLSAARELLLQQPFLSVFYVILIASGTHLVFLALNALVVSKWILRLPLPEGVAVLIMASQKSAPVAVTVITYITPNVSQQGLFAIPCLIGQVAQIFIGSALVKYLKRKVEKDEQD